MAISLNACLKSISSPRFAMLYTPFDGYKLNLLDMPVSCMSPKGLSFNIVALADI